MNKQKEIISFTEDNLPIIDIYKYLAEDSLHRFLLCLNDEIQILDLNNYNGWETAIKTSSKFTLFYLKKCYKERNKEDNSLNKPIIKKIKNIIKTIINDDIKSCYSIIKTLYLKNYTFDIEKLVNSLKETV